MKPMQDWVRTCQECGHKQKDKNPKDCNLNDFADRKCRKCTSMALDYGTMKVIEVSKETNNESDW